MAHGYCTGCQATVTVRGGECLVGHPVDPSTVSEGRGRHARSRKTRGRDTPVVVTPPLQASPPPPQATLTRPVPTRPPAPSRSASPASAALIDRLWAETEEHDYQLDWAADTGDLQRLGKQRRWGWLVLFLLVAGLGAGGWYGWQYYQDETEAQAVAGFEKAVEDLRTATGELESALVEGSGDPDATVAVLASLDDASRDLLVASGGLDPAIHESTRIEASEAAAGASELHDGVAAFHAYRALIGQVLEKPELPLTTGSVEIASAAASVGEWLGQIDAAVTEAPEHPLLDSHRELMSELRPRVDELTASYLTAIRNEDRAAAAAALSSLEQVLRDLRTELEATEADVIEWSTERLDSLSSYELAFNVPG